MHTVGEHIGVVCIRADQTQRAAGQRRCRRTGLVADIGEAVGARGCHDFLQDGEGVQRDELDAGLLQTAIQRVVVELGDRRALGHPQRTTGTRIRRQADIGQIRHQHVLSACGLQAADQGDLVLHRCTDDGRRLCGGRLLRGEQVVRAAPDGVQRIGVSLAAIGGQVAGRLGLQRRGRAQRADDIHAHAGAADGVVVAGLAIAVGLGVGAVMVSQIVRPDPARVGGEAADDGGVRVLLHQQRAEEAGVGQAVAEEHGLGKR
ncbi:hypothetical protein D3C71_1066520 [compost metagenome]